MAIKPWFFSARSQWFHEGGALKGRGFSRAEDISPSNLGLQPLGLIPIRLMPNPARKYMYLQKMKAD
jgi:hypothetical protein